MQVVTWTFFRKIRMLQNALQDIGSTNVTKCKAWDFLSYLLKFWIVRAVLKSSKSTSVEKHWLKEYLMQTVIMSFMETKLTQNILPSQVFQFLNAKCESAFLSKRNPRQINWTVLYRRKHKKGQSVSTHQFMALQARDQKMWSLVC